VAQAEIINSNSGAATIMENVTKGHRLIVIQNPDVTGGHEWEIVMKMEEGSYLIWCEELDQLMDSIEKARSMRFQTFQPDQLDLNSILQDLIPSKD